MTENKEEYLLAKIPSELKKDLKRLALDNDKTLKDTVIELLEKGVQN